MTVTDTETIAESAAEAVPWWSKPFRMYQTNLRLVDASMDVEAVLDEIEDFGANAWLLNGGGIYSFYPTDLPYQSRNPYLSVRESGDLVGDAFAAAKARDMRVLARMDFSKVESRIAAEHPDWCFIGPDGRKQNYHGLVSVCPSGPYYQRYAFDVLREFMSRYPVDGFFFNWFSFNEVDYSRVYRGVCHCAACVTGFADWSGGLELPASRDSPGYDVWRGYASHVIEELTVRFRTFIHDNLPSAALIQGASSDIVFHEANSALGREFWPHATGEAVSISKSRRPSVPVLMNPAVFVDMPYRFAPIQPEHFAHYYAQAIARGAIPSTYTMGTPFASPYPNMGQARAVMHSYRDNEDVYGGLRPAAQVLLVTAPASAMDPGVQEYRGLHEALQRRHIPFDVAAASDLEEILTGDSIARYRLLILPDTRAVIADSTARALDEFVDAGGVALTTGGALFLDDRPLLASSPARRRTASATEVEELRNSYVALEEAGFADGYRRLTPVAGSYHYLDFHDDAMGHLTYLAQTPYGPPEKCFGTLPVEYPGWASRRFGKGVSAIIPWGIGETARAFGTGAIGDHFADIVEELLGDNRPVLARSLPPQVEIVVAESNGRLVIHLLNFSGVRTNSIGPAVPVNGGELVVRGGACARALVAGEPCEALTDGDALVIRLPQIGLYEVIVVDSL